MPDPKDPAPDPKTEAPDDGSVKLTPDELKKQIAEAVEAARKEDREKAKKRKARKQRQQQEEAEGTDADDEDGDEEDPNEIIRKAELKAAQAEQRANDAEKKALLAQVENKLRDYLAANFRDLLGNSVDIMLHIERAITPGAKDQEVARLIESHSKAFAERAKATRKPASGAPMGGARRGFVSAGGEVSGQVDVAPKATNAARPYSTINWHG